MPRLVGGDRHRTAQRVDLLDEVSLADAADRRVARHLPERLDVVGEQQRARGPSARDASAASVPAWPPPTTITSNRLLEVHEFKRDCVLAAVTRLGSLILRDPDASR